jgi:glycosyltransferase involved in cell wall biosynthesis
MSERFSIVIPLYNKACYIQRALDSVLNQTYQEFEIIVIDDGSIDGGGNIVKACKDARINLIQQVNQGESAARNRGIEEAKAENIAFLDADDEWKSGFLEAIINLSDQFPNCGAYATSYDIVEPDLILSYRRAKFIPSNQWTGILPNIFRILQSGFLFCSSSIMVPKQVLKRINGFPVGVKCGGDLMAWIKIGAGFPIAYTSSRLSIYHQEAENRALNIYPNDSTLSIRRMLDEMLINQQVPIDLISDLKDYFSYLNNWQAKMMIKAGQMENARVFLLKSAKNPKYRKESIILEILSYFPFCLIRAINKLRLISRKYISGFH